MPGALAIDAPSTLLRDLLSTACEALGALDAAVVARDPEFGWRVVVATADGAASAAAPGDHPHPATAEPTGVVAVDEIAAATDRWPEFAAAAARAGYRSVYVHTLRATGTPHGTLVLFGAGPLPDARGSAGARIADVVTIGLLQDRALRQATVLAGQLQQALTSRIVIEQAKGILADRGNLPMEEAFARLRSRARSTNTRLSVVAQAVVDSRTVADEVLAAGKRPAPRQRSEFPGQRAGGAQRR